MTNSISTDKKVNKSILLHDSKARNMEYVKENYLWEDLLAIVKKLRAPDGCPWDRAQTHESMRSCLIEECYEVIEAVDNKDILNLREELGDVMLQVLLHSEIARDEQEFTLNEVINELAKKLVRRHPHVFGDGEPAKDTNDGLSKWEAIKLKEKAEASLLKKEDKVNELEKIPKSFPAIIRAQKVQKKAVNEFKAENNSTSTVKNLKKLISQYESQQANNLEINNDQNLVGNLIFEVVKLSGEMGVNAENSLTKATEEYINKVIRCSTYK